MNKYTVTIVFTDGTYQNTVTAASAERAIVLGTIDARQAGPYATFYGKVVSTNATIS